MISIVLGLKIAGLVVTSGALGYVLSRRKSAINDGIGDEQCTITEFTKHLIGRDDI